MTIFKNLFFTFVVVVIASGFIRGASFELLNVAKSISFGAIAIALLAFCVSFWAVKASIKAGEVEDEGIIFKK